MARTMRSSEKPIQRFRTDIYPLTHGGEFVNQAAFGMLVGMGFSGIAHIEQGSATPQDRRFKTWAEVLSGAYPGAVTALDLKQVTQVVARMVSAKRDGDREEEAAARNDANLLVDALVARVRAIVGAPEPLTAVEAP